MKEVCASMAEREILRDYITSLADLMVVTSRMTFKQVRLGQKVEGSVSKFRKASAKANFWSKALKGLDSAQIGALFFAISRIQEVFTSLANWANLTKAQQEEVLSLLEAVTTSLTKLKSSLSKR